ncbi:MAG TPA: hypothetical protein VFA09_05655 [Ktedonobacteraceae bacterium]|nr:hypothetical protein [Ktedonobacteraceae bacterium]
MQSFNQQPEEEYKQETGEELKSNDEMESPPLYEFQADAASYEPLEVPYSSLETQAPTGEPEKQQHSEEDIRNGLVYPPPPSYYQNMQIPLDRPPLPQAPFVNGPAPFVPGSYGPQQFGPPIAMPVQGTQVTQAPPFPGMLPPAQPPVKQSRKWLWILLSIFAVVFLVSCGLCSWAFYNLFNTTFQQVSGAMNVAQDYYKDLQNQDYVDAYNYLQVNNLTLADFTQQAQASDTQNGAIQSFTVEQPSFANNPSTGPDLSQWRATVDVTRAHASYPVLLTIQQFGNAWKITYFDKI